MEVGGEGEADLMIFGWSLSSARGYEFISLAQYLLFHAAATKSHTERGPVKALQMLVQIALEIQFPKKRVVKWVRGGGQGAVRNARHTDYRFDDFWLLSAFWAAPASQRSVSEPLREVLKRFSNASSGQCRAGLLSKSILCCLIIKLLFWPYKVGFTFCWVSSWRNRCLETSIYSENSSAGFFFFFITWFGSVSTDLTPGSYWRAVQWEANPVKGKLSLHQKWSL